MTGLDIQRLTAAYGRAQVLFEVSLRVGSGEAVALIGRNGAGKSTTLKSVLGLMANVHGSIRFRGVDISRLPTDQIVRAGLGYVPEDRRVFSELTVMENLSIGRQPPRDGAPHWTPEGLFELFPNLADLRHRRAGDMSGGEQQMLTIARTLMGNPHLIMLDEPSEGLSPRIADQLATTVIRMKAQGLSILLCEQNLRFARPVADRACIIEKGHVVHEGPMETLTDGSEAAARYLAV